MATVKQKRIRLVTPAGIARFPYLTQPDTKFNSDGEYKVNLLLDPSEPDVQELLEKLDELTAEAVEKAKEELIEKAKTKKAGEKAAAAVETHEPYRNAEDEDGEETGQIELRFKSKAQFKDRKTDKIVQRVIRLFGPDGKPLEEGTAVYGGAVIKVNFSPVPFYAAATKTAGITLQINAVQVIEFASGADASFYGFDAVEGADDDDEDTGDTPDAGEEDDF